MFSYRSGENRKPCETQARARKSSGVGSSDPGGSLKCAAFQASNCMTICCSPIGNYTQCFENLWVLAPRRGLSPALCDGADSQCLLGAGA